MSASHEQTSEAEALALDACLYLMSRMRADPGLAYMLGSGTEAWRRITNAVAANLGIDADEYRQREWSRMRTEPMIPKSRSRRGRYA